MRGKRMATSSEMIDAVTRHQVLLERLKSGAFAELNAELDKMGAEMRIAILSLEVATISELNKRELKELARALQSLSDKFLGAGAEKLVSTTFPEIAASEAAFEVALLSEYLKATIKGPVDKSVAYAYARSLPVSATGNLLEPTVMQWAASERAGLENLVRRGWTNGLTVPDMVKDLIGEKVTNFATGELQTIKRRAEAVVRTSIQHVSAASREYVDLRNPSVVAGYQWVSTLDGRTSQQCRSLDGQVFEVGKGPRPPIHFQCLPGDTLITASCRITRLFKRPFKGKVFAIRTRSGNVLTATPNHPILTDCGWAPAKFIQIGDKCVVERRIERVASVDGQDDCIVSSIEDIAEAFRASCQVISRKVPISAPDFHNDGANNEIAEVLADKDLLPVDYLIGGQHCREPLLIFGDVGFAALRPRLQRKANLPNRPPPSSRRIVGGLGKLRNFLGARASHSSKLLLRAISKLKARFLEDSLYWSWRDAETMRDAANSDSALVEIDNIVSVESRDFCGHVYNIETIGGTFIANNIVTHNCRSTTVPEISDEFDFLDEGATRASKDGPVDAKTTYYEWLKTQPESFQVQALGADRAKLFRDGGLSSERFAALNLNRRFDPLSLAEMQRLEPLAFERAGVKV